MNTLEFNAESGQLSNPWIQDWLAQVSLQLNADLDAVSIENYGKLPLRGEVAIWHPLRDLQSAPRIAFNAEPYVLAAWVRQELVGYIVCTQGNTAHWSIIGDVSTDTDRYFLVQTDQFDGLITWFNDDPRGFEALGGDNLIQMSEREDSTRVVMIRSYDGNAQIQAGYSESGLVTCAIIKTVLPLDN